MTVTANTIAEWMFNGVTFDGLDSGQCLLKEAKAKYDQFFDILYRQPKPFWDNGATKLLDETYRQGGTAQPRPPIQLKWYFMQPLSYRYFSGIINAAYPDIELIYEP